jgi:DNA-binding CsgD family transcriptional regulator
VITLGERALVVFEFDAGPAGPAPDPAPAPDPDPDPDPAPAPEPEPEPDPDPDPDPAPEPEPEPAADGGAGRGAQGGSAERGAQRGSGGRDAPRGLTRAERAVHALLVAGHRRKEIAARRGTAEGTVAKQVQSIYRKLGVRGRRELVALVTAASSSARARRTSSRGDDARSFRAARAISVATVEGARPRS